jgi:hypothetical protein
MGKMGSEKGKWEMRKDVSYAKGGEKGGNIGKFER